MTVRAVALAELHALNVFEESVYRSALCDCCIRLVEVYLKLREILLYRLSDLRHIGRTADQKYFRERNVHAVDDLFRKSYRAVEQACGSFIELCA